MPHYVTDAIQLGSRLFSCLLHVTQMNPKHFDCRIAFECSSEGRWFSELRRPEINGKENQVPKRFRSRIIGSVQERGKASQPFEICQLIFLQTGYNDCDNPVWQTTSTPQIKSKFPKNTIAVVVDVRQEVGVLRIFESTTGKYLDGVGTEEKGKMIMVTWETDWNYDTVGTVRLAYILKH